MEILNVRATDPWPEAVSDGLTLECPYCGCVPAFDYHVDEEFWAAVVPRVARLGVVCLPCLDRLATEIGMDVSGHVERIQFTGIRKTVEMVPVRIVRYENRFGANREVAYALANR